MTTNQPQPTKIYHVRYVEAFEAPVSLGFYATIEGAQADVAEQLGNNPAALWISETHPSADPDDNFFVACFESALDECGTNSEQVDALGVVDLLTIAIGGETVAVWWIEACDVKA